MALKVSLTLTDYRTSPTEGVLIVREIQNSTEWIIGQRLSPQDVEDLIRLRGNHLTIKIVKPQNRV